MILLTDKLKVHDFRCNAREDRPLLSVSSELSVQFQRRQCLRQCRLHLVGCFITAGISCARLLCCHLLADTRDAIKAADCPFISTVNLWQIS